MDSTTKTALLVAAGALILFVGYSLGKQAGESNLRFELTGRGENYLLNRATGQIWIMNIMDTNSTWTWKSYIEPVR